MALTATALKNAKPKDKAYKLTTRKGCLWSFPDQALAEFRQWFRVNYLATKYPAYILRKANILPGGAEEAKRLAAMYQPASIEDQRG